MALILTFLGKGGVGRSTIALAAAKRFARQGKRVLFAGQDAGPALGLLLGITPSADPQELEPNLQVVQFQTTTLLERSWEDVKKLEAQYLRTPFFKDVYGQELGVLPGMDSALALNAIREYDSSGSYDVIVYDGSGDQTTLRMLGMPEIASWYVRRFRNVFADSDLGKTVSPFIQPIAAAVLNVNWSGDMFNQPVAQQANNLLEQGRAAIADPNRIAAYLVTTSDEAEIATAKYLWGSAQQVGLTVGGVILNRASGSDNLSEAFAPLTVHAVPTQAVNDWQPLIDALPDFDQATQVPRPIAVNVAERKVSLFLPGFDKKQVKLTQSGPEITIEAGDQRRNVFLPDELRGRAVTGAKFQDNFLIISF
ncbi:ArsA family ATPase [Leptolyngbya sp. FACHB-36]|uniref:Get3/ArsA fold putative tail anchor-mediating ATPase NosAFP n=1 Tax=Leptolyngbya sp. FACHB-36 TaxID=2692808 RepID=UPI0016805D47|nr:ArsA family ATPase [Leptolyngbya sp. FACHB-36]MBD2021954.1 ArsA family ATPase [Leptolyngbya sp. FACHB-36]